MYYDVDGRPLELMEWATRFEDTVTRQIGHDEVGDATVSTVWLGIDHSLGSGPPLIFETMIFGGEHDEYQERYATKEQAEQGHAAALELVKTT